MDEQIIQDIEKLLPDIDLRQAQQLAVYVQELELWNPVYKLVAAADRAQLLSRHIADSLTPLHIIRSVLPRGASLRGADLGSGNGLPGIPLAIALPELQLTLVERSGRRAGFLRNAVLLCGLSERVTVCQSDITEHRRQYPLLVFRAFRPLPEIIDELDRLLEPGGVMCAYKSRTESLTKEIDLVNAARPGRYSFTQTPYSIPDTDAERRICLIRRV